MKIGIDLDGVCYDFFGTLRQWLVHTGKYPADSLPDPQTWDFYDEWGLTEQKFWSLCEQSWADGALFWMGHALPGTRWALNSLFDMGHTIHVVTNRRPLWRDATKKWLYDNALVYDELTFTQDKTTVDVDVCIDDSPKNYAALEAAYKFPWLADRPWNKGISARRVYNWTDFVAVVESLHKSESGPNPHVGWTQFGTFPEPAGRVVA